MDDDLENFLKEQRAKLAEDKANLKLNPPYLEIRAKHHKAYDHTLKENIPPFKRSTVLPKEESQSVSLSLGEDYERKKQKLQQELRQDYRCYMAREHGASLRPLPVLDVQPSPRPPSRRDAATLTEGRRGVHMGRHPTEVRGPWAEEDGLPYRESRTTRLGRVEPGDDDSDDDYLEDELELMERRRMETIQSERRRPRHYYKADSRFRDRRKEPHGDYIDPGNHGQRTSQENGERKENDGSVVREEYQDMHHRANQDELQSTRDTRSKSTSRSAIIKNEFATGLLIGAADADEVIQRRKERYRQELQEQIAEQQRNKKREKDLELRVTATGATDPEKVPDRIKHFGQTIVKRREDLYRAGLGQDEAPAGEEARRLPGDEKPSTDRERERLPPELPIVAFQSPLLEYSSALGLSNGGVSPYSQAVGFPRGIDTPRIPGIPLHPPTRMAEPYRSPYDEGYSYYGARNPLDPNLPYYGQMVMPGGVPLMSYLALPQTGGAPPSHPSLHGAQHSHPEAPPPPLRPNSDAGTVSSGISVFPAEKVLPSKESALSYKEALKQQIRELQERRRREKEERDRAEAKMEFHMKNHEPWGRGGCGAPLRDTRGNLITDLNQMHKENEEAWLNPETWQKRAIATVPVLPEELPSVSTVSGLDRVQTPKYARGSVFANQPTPQQLMEKDKYKSFLKQQIEEKRLKEAEEREKLRLEEEKEERRLAEQRARIQWEYNEEQERKKRKEMEQKAKNEELVRLAEERRKEAEKKKKEADEKEMAALRIQYEEERQARVEEVCREPSPPIPTLQKRHRAPQYTPRVPQYTPRPPTMDSRRSTAPMSECSLSGLQSQSPPVPARRNELRAAEDQRGVISELSALRRQLRSEQKRLEGQLLRSEWEELDSPMSDRHRERPQVDVFDMARLRLQAPVRRPLSRNIEPGNLLRIHDSLQLRYPDSDFRYGSSELHREEGQTVAAIQRQADHREQQPRRSSLRRKPGQDYFDLSPPQKPPHYLRDPGRGSLLESESAFINPLGDTYLVPHPPQRKPPQLSARERRRLAKNPESHHGREASRQDARLPDDYILQSESAGRAQEREHHNWTRRLPALRRRGRTTGDLSEDDEDDDEEEESPGVSPRGPHHRSSADTDATEPWMRPESSETLKRLMSGPFRRERLPPLKAIHTQDWDGPSTYHG